MSLGCLPIDSLPIAINLNTTIGAEFIGLVISTFLTGISTLQTYSYFFSILNNDRTPFRYLLGILWISDVLLTIFLTVSIYTIVITNFMDPLAAIRITWSIVAFLSTSSIFHFTIQCIIMSASSALAHQYVQLGNFVSVCSAKWLVIWTLSTLAFTDTFIAITLCYYLWRMKSSAAQRTESQIDTLMQFCLHTGVVTSLLSIAILITYLVMPDDLIFNGIYVILPKFYHNALMATLNSRDNLRTKLSGSNEEWKSIQLTAISTASISTVEAPGTNSGNSRDNDRETSLLSRSTK
ncbi:hypothetical protein C8Q75DRAFT_805337 [Abortiporus biennis]|nr:hypothetical protein C8Q75DRAFT_805337 [Abortiporus biennis]